MKDWEKLEEYVTNRMKEIDPKQRRTAGSGNKRGDLDSIGNRFIVSCKSTSRTDNVNIQIEDIIEADHAALRFGKEWIFVYQNNRGKKFALLDFDVLVDILAQKGEICI